jgi:flagellar L-ring protein precursor FlgH
MRARYVVGVVCVLTLELWAKEKSPKPQQHSELDLYLQQFAESDKIPAANSPGSLWSPNARLLDLGGDLRASRLGDLVTILIEERASAVARGATKTGRSSSAKASLSSIAGLSPPAVGGLVRTSSDQALNGEGSTSRENSLRTTLAAQVTRVLPNGVLLIQGSKQVTINSETQLVALRGIVRPVDIAAGNVVPTQRIALLEVKVNGKGVVNDAVRRPNFLYRLLLGLLPF